MNYIARMRSIPHFNIGRIKGQFIEKYVTDYEGPTVYCSEETISDNHYHLGPIPRHGYLSVSCRRTYHMREMGKG